MIVSIISFVGHNRRVNKRDKLLLESRIWIDLTEHVSDLDEHVIDLTEHVDHVLVVAQYQVDNACIWFIIYSRNYI